MLSRSRPLVLAAALFSLLALPLMANPAGGTAPGAAGVTTAPEMTAQEVAGIFGGAPLFQTALTNAQSIGASCASYHCPFCPDFPDLPPATCENGCCVYETSCDSCQFDSDCGQLASCWSGCCYYWTH